MGTPVPTATATTTRRRRATTGRRRTRTTTLPGLPPPSRRAFPLLTAAMTQPRRQRRGLLPARTVPAEARLARDQARRRAGRKARMESGRLGEGLFLMRRTRLKDRLKEK